MPDLTEKFDPRPDGRIELVLLMGDPPAAVSRRLRRPIFGELREIREAIYTNQDNVLEATGKIRTPSDDERPDGLSDGDWAAEKASRRVQMQHEFRATSRASEDANLKLVRDAIELLSGEPLPPDDELPPWLAEPDFIAAMLTHWRSIPLSPGDR